MNTKNPRKSEDDNVESLAHDLLGVDFSATDDDDGPLDVDGLGLDDLGFGPPDTVLPDVESTTTMENPRPSELNPDNSEDSTPAKEEDDPIAWIVSAAKNPAKPMDQSNSSRGFGSGVMDDDFGSGVDDDEFDEVEDLEDDDFGAESLEDDFDDDDEVDVEKYDDEEDGIIAFDDEDTDEIEEPDDAVRAERDSYWDALDDFDSPRHSPSRETRNKAGDRADKSGKSGKASKSSEKKDFGKHSKSRNEPQSRDSGNIEPEKKESGKPEKQDSSPKSQGKQQNRAPKSAPSVSKMGVDQEESIVDPESIADSTPKAKRKSRPKRRKPKPVVPVIEEDDDGFGTGILDSSPSSIVDDDGDDEEFDEGDEDIAYEAQDVEGDDAVDESIDSDDFGAGLDIDAETKRRSSPQQRRAPQRPKAQRDESAAAKQRGEASPKLSRERSSASKSEEKPSKSKVQETSSPEGNKDRYAGIPTWEEAISFLDTKKQKASSGRRSGGSGGGQRRGQGGGRRPPKKEA